MTHLADFGCIVGNMMIFVRTTDNPWFGVGDVSYEKFSCSALLGLKKRRQI